MPQHLRRPDPARPTEPVDVPDLAWGPSIGLLALALVLVVGGLGWWWVSASESPNRGADGVRLIAAASSSPAAAAPAPGAAASVSPTGMSGPEVAPAATAASPAAPRIWRQRDPAGDQTPDLADYVNEGERPGMAEVISRLHQAGVYTGLGAFSPPGTRPPLVGLAVPEDYVLPAGYVRHYQATDDGQRIEPILMYSPHQPPLDANGQLLSVPADRVVPAELAPVGLPLRRIVVPAPVDPSRGGR